MIDPREEVGKLCSYDVSGFVRLVFILSCELINKDLELYSIKLLMNEFRTGGNPNCQIISLTGLSKLNLLEIFYYYDRVVLNETKIKRVSD